MRSATGSDRMSCPLQRDKLISEFCEVIPSTLDALNSIQDRVLAVVKEDRKSVV